jgi:hypothetical protein
VLPGKRVEDPSSSGHLQNASRYAHPGSLLSPFARIADEELVICMLMREVIAQIIWKINLKIKEKRNIAISSNEA